MELVTQKNIIGISIRTTNENATNDIPGLWQRFIGEDIASQIPGKLNTDIYSIYTEYEGDHSNPYTVVLGCEVAHLDNVPNGFKGMTISKGVYEKYTANGDLSKGVIWKTWDQIWKQNLNRSYITDYEVYGEKAQDPSNVEVEIFVGIKG